MAQGLLIAPLAPPSAAHVIPDRQQVSVDGVKLQATSKLPEVYPQEFYTV